MKGLCRDQIILIQFKISTEYSGVNEKSADEAEKFKKLLFQPVNTRQGLMEQTQLRWRKF